MVKKKPDTTEIERLAELRGRIAGIQHSQTKMLQAGGDEYDRKFASRVTEELNRDVVEYQRQLAAGPRPPKVKGPPLMCPMGQQPAKCYRRDGKDAIVATELQGALCAGCERRVSTLEGHPE